MGIPKLVLPVLLGVLAIDCIIEVGFIGSMVSYLHIANHDIPYQIASTSSHPQFSLYPKPAHALVNQGHTSNGAAGTALILVSLLGSLVMWTEKRGRSRSSSASESYYTNVRTTTDDRGNHSSRKTRTLPSNYSWLHPTWVVFTVLSFLLTFSALIFTFVETSQTNTSHSTIDPAVAIASDALPGTIHPYPNDKWTPENWYKAVLKLPFVDESLKGHIRYEVTLMTGWRWNLIPLFLLGFVVMVIALMGWMERRREGAVSRSSGRHEKHLSATSVE